MLLTGHVHKKETNKKKWFNGLESMRHAISEVADSIFLKGGYPLKVYKKSVQHVEIDLKLE